MKILVGLLGLTVGLALPLFGQEPQAVSADVRAQVEAVFVKFQDAYNARDAEGIASTMTQDAVEMRSWAGVGDWKTSGGRSVSAGFQRGSRPDGEHDPADVSSRNRWDLRDCRLACRRAEGADDDALCAFGWGVEIEDDVRLGTVRR
jgi:hypothetical protein